MGSDNFVIDSFEEFIKGIDGLNCLVYKDKSVDISEVIEVYPKTSTDGTTPFVIEELDYDVGDEKVDFKTQGVLINRYIKFYPDDQEEDTKLIRIVDYDNETSTITLEEGFGEEIGEDYKLNIEVIKSIFIRPINKLPLGGQRQFSRRFIRFDMFIKTKEDSSKRVQNTIHDLITTQTSRYRSAEIKNDEGDVIGRMTFQNDPDYIETTDDDSQLIEFRATLPTEYYVSNLG
jgi:hypothetical protein